MPRGDGEISGASNVPVNDSEKAQFEVTAPWFQDANATEEDVYAEEEVVKEAFAGEQDDQETDEDELVHPDDEQEDEEEQDEPEPEVDEDEVDEPEPELPPKSRANKRIRDLSAKVKERDGLIESLREEMRLSRQLQEQHVNIYQQQHNLAEAQRKEWEAQQRMRNLQQEFFAQGLDVINNPAAKRLFDMYLKQQELENATQTSGQFKSEYESQQQVQQYYQQLDAEFDSRLAGYEVDKNVREWLRETAIKNARLNQLDPELAVKSAFAEAQKLGIQPNKRAAKRKAPDKSTVQRERLSARGSATVGKEKGQTRGGRKPAAARTKARLSLEDQIFPEFGGGGRW